MFNLARSMLGLAFKSTKVSNIKMSMNSLQIPIKETGYFSNLICDYVAKKEAVKQWYQHYPNEEGFKKQIQLKKNEFTSVKRNVLVTNLKQQYSTFSTSEKTMNNIELLSQDNTFTIVTGHQLNIFTGPLYFLYKIVNTINLAKELKTQFPENNFVPIYWMATEDHDFEEINHFFVNNSKISWDVKSSGAVGRHDTKEMEKVLEAFSNKLGTNKNARYLKELFSKAYLEHANLSDATRYLVNTLFGEYGLVIIDGDTKDLKTEFAPYAKKELENINYVSAITDTNLQIEKDYKVQVNPREINLFYLKDGLRERIVFEANCYKILNSNITFSEEEILNELKNNPENFSPNVMLRPLYQEIILPNICYVGGGGEIAYWLQLKNYFEKFKVTFPVLKVRNSVLLISKKQKNKLDKLAITIPSLFLKQELFVTKKVKEWSELKLDFSKEKEVLKNMFESLRPLVTKTDITFEGALNAQEKKQLKGLENLEKRLLKAEKRNLSEKLARSIHLQSELFPRQGLQERNVNFAEIYESYGENLIPFLLEYMDPFSQDFVVLVPNE